MTKIYLFACGGLSIAQCLNYNSKTFFSGEFILRIYYFSPYEICYRL